MRTNWPRSAGRKPVREMRVVLKNGLATKGSNNAVVAAMALRKEGVSQPQVIAACGAPHRNKIKQLRGLKTVRSKVRQEGRIKFYHLRVVQ